MADDDRTFNPERTQLNRGRAQGLGIGERELGRQRDPDRIPQTPLELEADDDLRSQPGDEEAVLHANRVLRGAKTEAERGQGAKTRAAHKDQISRR